MREIPNVTEIPVIGDIPTDRPGLGFQEYAEAIAGAVKGGNPPQFTIGLYGPWGSGKTSLLKAIERILVHESDVITVSFDAWRYERSEHIILPLLYSIYSSAEKHEEKKVGDVLKRALVATIASLSLQIGVPGQGVSVSGKNLVDNWNDQGRPALDDAFARPFNELRRLPQVLEGRRIVVLIDDLDRCSAEKVVSVLESINLVMDVHGFIFVLALDYDVLVNAINEKYKHVSGDDFVQKIIQLPFRVPPLSLKSTGSLAELIPNWRNWAETLPRGLPEHLRDISELGLASNPRQIKRLINSFLLVNSVLRMRRLIIDLTFLATLLGIQLRWPQHFREFQQRVLSNDSDSFNPFNTLSEDVEEWDMQLKRYLHRFVRDTDMPTTEIREVLQLTAVVAVDEETPISYEYPVREGVRPVSSPKIMPNR